MSPRTRERAGVAFAVALLFLVAGCTALASVFWIAGANEVEWLCLFGGDTTRASDVYYGTLLGAGFVTWLVVLASGVAVSLHGRFRLALLAPVGWLGLLVLTAVVWGAVIGPQSCQGGSILGKAALQAVAERELETEDRASVSPEARSHRLALVH